MTLAVFSLMCGLRQAPFLSSPKAPAPISHVRILPLFAQNQYLTEINI
jgi:hypothetical protein